MSPRRTLSESDLEELLRFTIALARKAGDVMTTGSHAMLTTAADISKKATPVDLVTEWDVKIEELIRGEIESAWPGFGFVGEESFSAGPGGRVQLTDEPTFCVDPIDGTTNFVHGFPFACISIGLLYERQPILGVVFCPALNQLYTGRRGHGSFLNETQRLPLFPARPLANLSDALVGIEWGSKRDGPQMQGKLDSFHSLAARKMVHGLRSLGSAAMNYCMVATGGLDLYWEIGCWPWDIAAGSIIAQEAGAFVSGSADAPHDGVLDERVLAGRKYIVVRGVSGSENETALKCQQRLVEEFYAAVVDYDP